ncbi:hypothetical protein [Salmonirosea aquatica]|uniref:Uncharacterized protein n=1 Tax=Salmonirosea aquatica TaxID=2654236 RepID=A0A7C9FNI3_9BACT|nr:hypothetical protein [Cytophagaceae bacterium SJW1-29]
MKHVLYAFLISICVMSSIANGKKYVFEGDSVVAENCEAPDSDESDTTLDFSLFTSEAGHTATFLLSDICLINPFRYLSKSFSPIDLDYFSPPPNSFCPVLS